MKAAYLGIFLVFSIRSVIEDIRSYRVKIYDLALGMAACALAKFLLPGTDWYDTLLGGLLGAATFALVARFSGGRLGSGDAWMSAFAGFAFGFWTWDRGMIAAVVLGIAWLLGRRLAKRDLRLLEIRLPFAPCIFLGMMLVFLYEEMRL